MMFFIHYSLLAVFQQSMLQYLDDSSLDKKPSMIYIQVNQIYQIIHLIQFTPTKRGTAMAEIKKTASCTDPTDKGKSCCRIESLLAVDERGQMVLPKELRERAGIQAGDKLALISWVKDGRVCCFSLIKAEMLEAQVRDILGPIMSDMNPSNP